MAVLSSNGTTISFNSSTPVKLRTVKTSRDGNPIDVTGLEDSQHVFVNGIPNNGVTCNFFGAQSTITLGATGTLVVTYPDSTTDSLGTCLVTKRERGADVDGALTTDITFQPYGG